MTREALKLALEALIDLDALHHQDEPESVFAQKTITAIKVALAAPVPEPVYSIEKLDAAYELGFAEGRKTTPPAAQREPDELTIAYMSGLYDGKKHAKQREWVGLTDEERNECVNTPFVSQQWANIEAKLKEKNT